MLTFIISPRAVRYGLALLLVILSSTFSAFAQSNTQDQKGSMLSRGGASSFAVGRTDGLNSHDRDNNPIVTADGSVMFFNSTRKGDRPWARYDSLNKRFDDDIYFSKRVTSTADGTQQEQWGTPVNLGRFINTDEDDGIATICPDGQAVYFVSMKRGWQRDGGPFYRADLMGTVWANVQGMGDGITDFFRERNKKERFKVYGASITTDCRDFYFATSVHSKNGNLQLWVSHRSDDGKWGFPVNLGPQINTALGSYAPCIASDNKTLFFSSNRPDGYGGDDIYVTSKKNGEWQTPENLGSSINSDKNEAFPSLNAAGDKLYYSIAQGNDDDIFTSILPEEYRPGRVTLLTGQVVDKVSGRPVEATVEVEDLEKGTTVLSATSNSETGEYTVVLPPGHDYGISIKTPSYLFVSDRFTMPTEVAQEKVVRNFALETLTKGKRFAINNVFFEYNSSDVQPESFSELGRMIDLLKSNTMLRIKIHGHTDGKGTAEYNERLSSQRAESVKNYLINVGGIEATRVITRGYGARVPIAPNSTEAGRKQNRRTEFTVIDM